MIRNEPKEEIFCIFNSGHDYFMCFGVQIIVWNGHHQSHLYNNDSYNRIWSDRFLLITGFHDDR